MAVDAFTQGARPPCPCTTRMSCVGRTLTRGPGLVSITGQPRARPNACATGRGRKIRQARLRRLELADRKRKSGGPSHGYLLTSRAEGSTFLDRAVPPEDDDVRFVNQCAIENARAVASSFPPWVSKSSPSTRTIHRRLTRRTQISPGPLTFSTSNRSMNGSSARGMVTMIAWRTNPPDQVFANVEPKSSAVGHFSDGFMDTLTLLSAPHDSGGSSERDHHRRVGHRHDVMSDNFLAGLLVGLVMGGFVGTLTMAFVAAGSEKRSHRSRKPRLPAR